MKLTQDQIQELYTFTRQHYVEYYDLQTELVDHLGSGIEEQWEENKKISFEDALNVEFKKFGVFGFMHVIEQKKKMMNKRYRKIILRFYKDYLKLPKVLLLLVGVLCLFLVVRSMPVDYRGNLIQGILLLASIISFVFAVKNKKKSKKNDQKKWLLKDIIFQFGDTLQIVLFFYYYPFGLLSRLNNIYLEFCVVMFTISYIVLCYIMVYVIPNKADELLKKTYLEYK